MIKFFRALKNLKFSIDGQCPATQRGRPVGVDEGGAANSELSLCEKTTKKGRKIYYKTKQQKEMDKKGKEIVKEERAKSGGKLRGRIAKATKETISQRINEMKEIVRKMSGFREGDEYDRPDIAKMPKQTPEETERIDVKPTPAPATAKKSSVDLTTDLGDTTEGLSDEQLKIYESRVEYNKKLEKDFTGGSYGFLGKEIEKAIPELSGVKKTIGMGEQLLDGSFADSGTIDLGDVAKWLDRKSEWEERHANLAKVLLQVSRLHGRGEHAFNNDYVSEKDVKKAMGMLGFLANKKVIPSDK